MTQKQLAELAMLSESYISLIEKGSKIPSLYTLEKISKALKVSMGSLIKDDINYTKHKNKKGTLN